MKNKNCVFSHSLSRSLVGPYHTAMKTESCTLNKRIVTQSHLTWLKVHIRAKSLSVSNTRAVDLASFRNGRRQNLLRGVSRKEM